jgi:hypothetical protein
MHIPEGGLHVVKPQAEVMIDELFLIDEIEKKYNGCEMLQQCACRETIESCGYYAEWNAKHVCDGGQR